MSQVSHNDKNSDILDLENSLKSDGLDAVGRLLILWKDAAGYGLPPSKIRVKPKWDPKSLNQFGFPGNELSATPNSELLDAISAAKISVPVDGSKSKTFLRGIARKLSDTQEMTLELGGTDFQTSLNIQKAFSTPVPFRGLLRTLKEHYESGALSIFKDCFGILFVHGIFLTEDGYLLLGQRHDDETVHFCRGQWCVSADEQFDPRQENQPHETVIRCLQEEWLTKEWLDAKKIEDLDIRLLAVGREWGVNWNTALVYVVRVPGLTHDQLLKLWNNCDDQSEHQGIALLRIRTEDDLQLLLDAARRNEFDKARFLKKGNIKFYGLTTNNKFHDTMGLAAVVMTMRNLRAKGLGSDEGAVVTVEQTKPSRSEEAGLEGTAANQAGKSGNSSLKDELGIAAAPKMQDPSPTTAVHNSDFTMIDWYGKEYRFTLGVRSRVVELLWKEWEKTGMGLHLQTIRKQLDSEQDNFRVDTTFRGHPAWGTMIVRAGKGCYRLAGPNSATPSAVKGLHPEE